MPLKKTNDCRLSVRVVPNANQTEIVGWMEGTLKIKLKVPPTKGRANATLLKFLSEKLHLPKKSIQLISGKTTQNKVVEIHGCPLESVLNTFDPPRK